MAENKKLDHKEPSGQPFAGLAEEMFEWSREEKFPENVSGDAAYILQAQRQRLRQKGLEMEYDMTSQDFFCDKRKEKGNMLFLWWGCEGVIRFITDSGRQKRFPVSMELCGNAPWLGRRYLVEKLYWKTKQKTDRKKILQKVAWCFGIGAVIGFFVALYHILIQDSMAYVNLLINPVIGALLSYAVYALVQLGRLLCNSIRTLPLIQKNNQTAMEITSVMQLLNQDFYYPFFEAQMVNLLQRVIYAQDIREVAEYEPEARERSLEEIVHSAYEGFMVFRGYHTEAAQYTLYIDLYMRDIYCTKNRLRQRRDVFHMAVSRDFGKSHSKDQKWIITAMWRN